MASGDSTKGDFPGPQWFATTHWSVVLAAGRSNSDQREAALQKLCKAYWYPLYAYIRWRGHRPEDAQDLTQEFFLKLIEKNWLSNVVPEGARFRSFLLTVLKGFLANAHDYATAAKRGGGRVFVSLDSEQAEDRFLQEPAMNENPETAFDRRWALAVLADALQRLRAAAQQSGKVRHFELLQPFLSREPGEGEYSRIGEHLKMSRDAVGVAVHRLRQRYREMLRATVADTLSDPRDGTGRGAKLCVPGARRAIARASGRHLLEGGGGSRNACALSSGFAS